jgi:hypothetical protein
MSEAASATALPEPTPDERSMATLAHVLQMVGGFIAPLITTGSRPTTASGRLIR